MHEGHEDLRRLEALANERDVTLFAYPESTNEMAMESSDNLHICVFDSFCELIDYVKYLIWRGKVEGDLDGVLYDRPEVSDVLDDPEPVLDVRFYC